MENDLSWLLNAAAALAPIVGELIAPGIGGLIGAGVGALIGSINTANAASGAEDEMRKAAQRQYELAQQALNSVSMNTAARQLTKEAVNQLGGALSGAGLYGSSIADTAYRGLVSDIIAQLAPQQTSAILNATQLAMSPYGQLTSNYGQFGLEAAKTGGIDMGWLAQMMNGANWNIDWSSLFSQSASRNAIIPGGY